MHFRQLWKHQL